MVNMGFVPGKSLLKKTFPARFFLSLCLPQPTLSPKILLLFFLCFPFPPQATSGLDSLNHKNRASTLSMNFSPSLKQLASPKSSQPLASSLSLVISSSYLPWQASTCPTVPPLSKHGVPDHHHGPPMSLCRVFEAALLAERGPPTPHSIPLPDPP